MNGGFEEVARSSIWMEGWREGGSRERRSGRRKGGKGAGSEGAREG